MLTSQLIGVVFGPETSPQPLPFEVPYRPVPIVVGGQISFQAKLFDVDTWDPYDLTGIYDIQAHFANADGTILTISKIGGGITVPTPTLIGKVNLALTAPQSTALNPDTGVTLQLHLILTIGADPIIVSIPAAYDVLEATP